MYVIFLCSSKIVGDIEISMEVYKTRSHIADSVSLELTLEVSRALLKYNFISRKAQTYSIGQLLIDF